MILSQRVVLNLLGSGLIGCCIFVAPANADDVAVRYQVINTQQGNDSAKWSFDLQLLNLSGDKLTNLSIGLLTTLSSPSNEDQILLDELSATAPRRVTTDLSVPLESLSTEGRSLRFYVDYETADGDRRSAVVQGEATVFAGEVSP